MAPFCNLFIERPYLNADNTDAPLVVPVWQFSLLIQCRPFHRCSMVYAQLGFNYPMYARLRVC